MKTDQKLHALEDKARALRRQWAPGGYAYPTEVVDLIIFHKLHLAMPLASALKSFRHLKSTFVDWNEVRISSVREIQEALVSTPDSLSLAIFIKELLEFVHREQQDVSLEFLVEQNLGDIRRYLRQVRGLDSSTVSMILRVRKEHPVLPLTRSMEAVLARIGVLTKPATRDRKERALHEMVAPDKALEVHHFLLNHSQEFCPPDEADVACGRCCMRRMCAFYAVAALRRKRRGASRSSRSTNGRSASA